jgi:folate-binding protein YgfZ
MTGIDPHHEAVALPLARDVLRVAGPDAAAYLQGQLSQDLEPMAVGDSAWTFALAPNGKVDAWFRVGRREDDWILDVDDGYGLLLARRLTRFLLRTEATVEPLDWQAVAVRGPGAAATPAPEGVVAADPAWPGIDGIDLLGPSVRPPAGLPMGATAEYDALRIESGVPAMGHELDGSTIPAAAGVVERSVSFTKGCFTGQELVARIQSRGGAAPTRLCGLVAPSDAVLEPGWAVTVDGEEAGTITSLARSPWRRAIVGLVRVKRAVGVPVGAQVVGSTSVDLLPVPIA